MSDSLSETMNDSLAKALRDLNVDLDAIRAEIESTSHWNPDPHYLDASRARDSRRYPWSNGELEVGYHNVSVPKGLGYVPVDAFAQKDKIDTHFYIPYPDAVDVPYNLQAEQLYDTIPSPYGNFIHVQSAADSNPRRGFGRQSNKAPQQQNKGGNAPSPSYQTAPSMASSSSQNLPNSPALSATMSFENVNHSDSGNQHRNPPFFFREQYANLIVKGNFMTLAAKPVLIEEGEWLAHQVVEQNRLLDGMLKIIQEQDRNTGLPICNPQTCPAMTAGNTTYTWLNNNKESVRVPANQYISYVQKWITGKITDQALFPTDTNPATASSGNADPNATWLGKSSNFPSNFGSDIRNIYRQMLRCYAHIYHSHWMEFWHLGAYKELNTCFIHFVNVGRLFGLLGDKELEPLMPLVEIWLEKGWLPRPSSSQGAAQAQSHAGHSQHGSQGSQLSQGQGQGVKKENEGYGAHDRSDRRDMAIPQSQAQPGHQSGPSS